MSAFNTTVPEKICLVIPPSVFLLDERVFTTLGILKVAASLEVAGWPVEVLDLSGFTNYEEITRLHVAQSEARIFALTTTTPQMPATANVAAAVREARPDAATIIGGPHPTLIAAALKYEQKQNLEGRAHKAFHQLEKMFDVIVAGDGEDAIFEAIAAVETDQVLVDADSSSSPMFLTSKRLDESPWPARHLVDLESYKYEIEGYRATSLIAQLGCPFNCGFCGGRQSPMLRRIRTRTSKNIIDELEFLHLTYGYRGFMFYDDELNVNKDIVQLMDGICDLQDKLGTDFRLRGFVKAELFTAEQAEVMYRAGFRQLLTGFESGSPRILENINKKATRDDNSRAVEFAKSVGMKVKALMSLGHPGESHQTVEDTKNWLLEAEPDDFDCTIITTYPGSPYYDHALETKPGIWTYEYKKTGDRLHAYELDYNVTADYYKGDPDGGYKAYVFSDHISSEELVAARDALEKEVREKLNIPFNPSAASVNYEHSMGQMGPLPANILRASVPEQTQRKAA
ncbi:MAG: B12-binding domain-containing radical SAM protein [Planctomycetaceae bacterium]|nr:B12-binding domain-containing radical SAM protein [Planctomycetaceae bacterium]MBT6153500.1 B12-binding domain-containing radical SAM protein [Planctomycetaceae bacterium]MBT6486808.1 B12-binding domain-containing radical SAM protein [Planctomycetaceae bacterium]MBT6495498.1 B12-binding domain-containing radical SAM protein [Planctomycetaceae bacterium]